MKEVAITLLRSFYKTSGHKSNLADLNMSLGVAVPRIDYFLSYYSLISGKKYSDLIGMFFKDGLKNILLEYYKQGYLNKFGSTVNGINYICRFDEIELDYYWIPKNACTYLKRNFSYLCDKGFTKTIKMHQFHETIQAKYGLTMKQYLSNQEKQFKSLVVVREPIERFVSCYVDKFAKPILIGKNFEPFIVDIILNIYSLYQIKADPRKRSISFSEFMMFVLQESPFSQNEHWKPQSKFLPSHGVDIIIKQSSMEDYLLQNHLFAEEVSKNKANRSVGVKYSPDQYTGELAELLPNEYSIEKINDYSQYVTHSARSSLSKFYEDDYKLYCSAE
ncbi:sulfotransferase family 2 domain-containing protein [Methyloprofundus sp.]|uniref:sulfotransferase family 2 domain-containing protein n=1 Tax=Methyloprofundus sp. TaxID=2020875 RepID=UPI003D09BE87